MFSGVFSGAQSPCGQKETVDKTNASVDHLADIFLSLLFVIYSFTKYGLGIQLLREGDLGLRVINNRLGIIFRLLRFHVKKNV